MAAVRDWSDGRYTKAGCNLKFILDWAWARVVEIKVSLIQSQSQSNPKGNLASGLSLKSYGPPTPPFRGTLSKEAQSPKFLGLSLSTMSLLIICYL